MKTIIEVRLDTGQSRVDYIKQYSWRGRIGFIFLWLIGVISFIKN